MPTKKMSFANLEEKLSREAIKKIMGGSSCQNTCSNGQRWQFECAGVCLPYWQEGGIICDGVLYFWSCHTQQ